MNVGQASFLALVLTSLWAAFRYGGALERQAVIVLVSAALLSGYVQFAQFAEIERGIIVIDGLLLVYLFYINFITKKRWPAFACAFHVCGLLTHLNFMMNVFSAYGYASTTVFWSYMVLLSVLFGSLTERK